MQSNYLLVPWNRWKQEKKNSLREAPARLLAFQCQPHTAVHIVSLILWNMYFVLFSYLFADKANVSCRLPPRWAPTELGLVHPTSNLTTSPGTNYLRALTCRPLVWGSVTLPTAWSYCTSHPECYIFSNFTIVVPFPGTWPCTFPCTHFSYPAILYQTSKTLFCILRRVPWFNFQQSHWNIAM